MDYKHFLDIPRVREVCEEDEHFRGHLEKAWGKAPLPEGYKYNSIEINADGCSLLYQTPKHKVELNILLEEEDWTTAEIFLDNELVYARVSGFAEPIIDRAPKSFSPNF